MGFEAASRGAKSILLVEKHKKVFSSICENIDRLDASDQIQVMRTDALAFLKGPSRVFDLVFLDPPFGQDIVPLTCQLLERCSWLSATAKIYVEMESSAATADLPVNWRLLKQKAAGDVKYALFQRNK